MKGLGFGLTMANKRKVGFVTHEYYFWHDTGTYAGSYKPGKYIQAGKHWESPESKRRFKSLVDVSDLKMKLLILSQEWQQLKN